MFPSWKSNRKTKFSLIILKQKINTFPQMALSWKTGKTPDNWSFVFYRLEDRGFCVFQMMRSSPATPPGRDKRAGASPKGRFFLIVLLDPACPALAGRGAWRSKGGVYREKISRDQGVWDGFSTESKKNNRIQNEMSRHSFSIPRRLWDYFRKILWWNGLPVEIL